MISAKVPGKLFVAGEYAVVEPGQPAILIAVDRYLTARLTESSDLGRIHSGEYGHAPLEWTRAADGVGVVLEHRPADYVLSAIQIMELLRSEMGIPARYFDLDITSELDDAQGRKFGLGSSAAVTVAVIAALDEFYGFSLTRTQRFKLALLATISISPNASGGDLAACTFGGWIHYSAPDREQLLADLSNHGVAETLQSAAWNPYHTSRLPSPSELELLVGWTGNPASTGRLVDGVRHRRNEETGGYERFLEASAAAVDTVADALQRDDAASTLAGIRQARRLMRQLGDARGIEIETPALAALCNAAERVGAAAKPSGAGGGDCGIVLAPESVSKRELLTEWESHDIRRLDLTIHPPEGITDDS